MVNSHLSANTTETVCNMSDFMTQGMYGCSLMIVHQIINICLS